MQLTIPAGVVVHFKNVETFTDGTKKTIKLIENPTFTTGDVDVPAYNRKRDNAIVASEVSIYSNPTSISGGTTLREFTLGSGSAQIGAGGVPSDKEWLLYGAGTWIIQLTNNDATAAIMFIDADYYEEKGDVG